MCFVFAESEFLWLLYMGLWSCSSHEWMHKEWYWWMQEMWCGIGEVWIDSKKTRKSQVEAFHYAKEEFSNETGLMVVLDFVGSGVQVYVTKV